MRNDLPAPSLEKTKLRTSTLRALRTIYLSKEDAEVRDAMNVLGAAESANLADWCRALSRYVLVVQGPEAETMWRVSGVEPGGTLNPKP